MCWHIFQDFYKMFVSEEHSHKSIIRDLSNQ